MRIKRRIALAVLLVSVAMVLNGCLFNMFQTAKMLQSGDVSVLIGSGVMNIGAVDDPAWSLTPQVRMGFGLSDKVNLGLQTGVLIPLTTGEPGWMGAAADLKFGIVNDPESISLSVGFGGGQGIHFLGWGLFGQVFLDLNVFPIFFAYQPVIPLTGGEFLLWHDLAAGLSLQMSENSRLLFQIDTRNFTLVSIGLGFDIAF